VLLPHRVAHFFLLIFHGAPIEANSLASYTVFCYQAAFSTEQIHCRHRMNSVKDRVCTARSAAMYKCGWTKTALLPFSDGDCVKFCTAVGKVDGKCRTELKLWNK